MGHSEAQFSLVHLLHQHQIFYEPTMDCSCAAVSVYQQLTWVCPSSSSGMMILVQPSHVSLFRPPLSSPSIPSIRVFSNWSSSSLSVRFVWSFGFQHQSFHCDEFTRDNITTNLDNYWKAETCSAQQGPCWRSKLWFFRSCVQMWELVHKRARYKELMLLELRCCRV